VLTFIARRAAYSVVVVAGVLLVVFVATRLIGDPVRMMLPLEATEADYQALSVALGYDQPIHVQFVRFVSGAIRGDFGNSLWQQSPALGLVLERLPATLQLVVTAMVLAVLVAVPAGVLAARRPRSLIDRVVTMTTLLGVSIPNFVIGMLLILVFAVGLGWFSTSGYGSIRHLVLPAIAVALPTAGRLTQVVRSAMIDELSRPYTVTARSKGVAEPIIALRHALRNASIPIFTLGGWEFVRMLAGYTVAVEVVFAWPGVAQLAAQAILQRDLPLIQADVFVVALMVVVVNLLVDISYPLLDPRVQTR
jgi:peptide/nickel transport system permease protein